MTLGDRTRDALNAVAKLQLAAKTRSALQAILAAQPLGEVSPRVLAELRAVAHRLDVALGSFVARAARDLARSRIRDRRTALAPARGSVLEGRIVAAFGRWPAVCSDGTMITSVLETDDGERWHVARTTWASLHEELKRVRPLEGDRVRIVRLEDDAEGRRQFRVERLGAEDPQP